MEYSRYVLINAKIFIDLVVFTHTVAVVHCSGRSRGGELAKQPLGFGSTCISLGYNERDQWVERRVIKKKKTKYTEITRIDQLHTQT